MRQALVVCIVYYWCVSGLRGGVTSLHAVRPLAEQQFGRSS
jgi:hypothetical protein